MTSETKSDGISLGRKSFEPELVFAFVRAIGTDLLPVSTGVESILNDARFETNYVRLSDDFRRVAFLTSSLNDSPEDERYRTFMNAGDLLRAYTRRSDAVALLGVKDIRSARSEYLKQEKGRGLAHLLRSMMHPEEIRTLRRIYGNQFFVVSVFAPEDVRERELVKRIAETRGENPALSEPIAKRLMNRDIGILDPKDEVERFLARSSPYLLDVRRTFQLADLFVSSTAPDESRAAVRRFVELIFSNPFITPTRDEFGMAVADLAARRSSSLARTIGAAITDEEGNVVAVGCNDVPKYRGGLYWEGDDPDKRDHKLGYDSSDRIRRQLLTDFFRRISSDWIWLKSVFSSQADYDFFVSKIGHRDPSQMVNDALASALIREAHFLDVIEYGRNVHAEMAALTDAALRGVSVRGMTVYCTTFPCHNCARHLVAAGISRVVYIEPYPKSRVGELHSDSIGLGDRESELGNRLRFEPFVGIAPRRFDDLFTFLPRKIDDVQGAKRTLSGQTVAWSISNADLRPSIAERESLESGARAVSVDVTERHVVAAFDARLEEAQAQLDRLAEQA